MSKEATGVQTNGKGWITTKHLNLTRSLADVWAEQAPPEYPEYADNRFTAKTRRKGQ
jgi:hypothetical protein